MSSPQDHEQPCQTGGLLTGILAQGDQRHHTLVPQEECDTRRVVMSMAARRCDQHGCGGDACLHRNHRRDVNYLQDHIGMLDLLGPDWDEDALPLDLNLE